MHLLITFLFGAWFFVYFVMFARKEEKKIRLVVKITFPTTPTHTFSEFRTV